MRLRRSSCISDKESRQPPELTGGVRAFSHRTAEQKTSPAHHPTRLATDSVGHPHGHRTMAGVDLQATLSGVDAQPQSIAPPEKVDGRLLGLVLVGRLAPGEVVGGQVPGGAQHGDGSLDGLEPLAIRDV